LFVTQCQRAHAISIRGRAEAERGTDPRPSYEKAVADHEKAIAIDHKYAAAYADECVTYQYISDWLADQELDPIPQFKATAKLAGFLEAAR